MLHFATLIQHDSCTMFSVPDTVSLSKFSVYLQLPFSVFIPLYCYHTRSACHADPNVIGRRICYASPAYRALRFAALIQHDSRTTFSAPDTVSLNKFSVYLQLPFSVFIPLHCYHTRSACHAEVRSIRYAALLKRNFLIWLFTPGP
jgi:hypothetical protein